MTGVGQNSPLTIHWDTSKGVKDCGWYSLPESLKSLLTGRKREKVGKKCEHEEAAKIYFPSPLENKRLQEYLEPHP